MRLRVTNLTAVTLASLISLAAPFSAAADGCTALQDENVPKDWRSAVSFYGANERTGSGIFFTEIKDKSLTRLIAAFDQIDPNTKKHFYCVKYFEISELQEWKQIWSADGHDVVYLRSTNLSENGGTIELKLLSNALTVFGNSYNENLSFELQLAAGNTVVRRDRKWFNVLELHARTARIPLKGVKKIGIEHVSFCRYSCTEPGRLNALEFKL